MSPDEAAHRDSAASRRQLIAVLARGRWTQLAGLGVLLVVSSALPLAGPQLLRLFIDQAVLGRPFSVLAVIAGGFLGASLLHQMVSVALAYVSTHLTWAATNELREEVSGHALGLDLSFHERQSPGQMIERVDGDVTALSSFASSFVVQVVGSTLTLLGVLVAVFVEDWRIGIGAVGYVLVSAATLARLRDFAVPLATERRSASARLFGEIEERLAGAEDLRANGGGAHTVARFQRTLTSFIGISVRASIATRTMWVAMSAVFAAGGVLTLLAGTMMFQAGAISLGTVYLLFRYTGLVQEPLEQIFDNQMAAQEAVAGFTRIRQLLDEEPSIRDTGRFALPAGPLSVELDGLRFSYAKGPEVLHGIDLQLRPGSVLGLVGRTGSGKTTISRLLLRLREPTAGALRIGHREVRDVRLAELRRRVALVTQEVQLFEANLRDNLTLFDTHPAGDNRLVEVLDNLGLGAWYRALPDGLDTYLGPGGEGLSGGEAQLVTFARVFLCDPGLVILDEATSRLDPVSEERLEHALDELLVDRTAIVIAHRLSTLDRVDEIAVMERGQIVERGRRADLVDDTSSRFAGLLTTASGGSLR